MNRACAGEGSFFEVTFPGAFGQREVVLMELAILIALAALAVDIIDTMFNIGWSVYIERKHNKKEKCPPLFPNTRSLSFDCVLR